jgi:hypothetical protein
MASPDTHPDPLVEAQIVRALAPYQGIATSHMLQTMRDRLADMLTSDPLAVSMMEQLRDHAVPGRSGESPTDGAADPGKVGGGQEGA